MKLTLKVLRKLACTNNDVFLANFQRKQIIIAKKLVQISEAIAVIEAYGNTACFLPYADVASYDITLNAIHSQVKFGGIFNCPSSFVLKINKEKIAPNFTFIVLKFTSKSSQFVGIAITYHIRNISSAYLHHNIWFHCFLLYDFLQTFFQRLF